MKRSDTWPYKATSPGYQVFLESPELQGREKAQGLADSSLPEDTSLSHQRRTKPVNQSIPQAWQVRVLLTLRLRSNAAPATADWTNWLREQVPDEIIELEGVKLDCSYLTHSRLQLVTMPVHLWAVLPDNPAYTFIDFVTSDCRMPLKKSDIYDPDDIGHMLPPLRPMKVNLQPSPSPPPAVPLPPVSEPLETSERERKRYRSSQGDAVLASFMAGGKQRLSEKPQEN